MISGRELVTMAAEDRDTLLATVAKLTQESREIRAELARLYRLRDALRNAAKMDAAAAVLLTTLDDPELPK